MLRNIFLVLITLMISTTINAQDIRFSQYYSAPLLYNPAFTGYFNGDVRASAIYKSQWQAPFNAYRTIGGGADFSIAKQKFNGSGFGVGVHFFSDQAGDLNLNTNQLLLSLAYTQKLGQNMPNYLSAGFQMTGGNKSINFSNAIYENQLNGGIGGDVIGVDNYWYYSMGLGLLWYAEPADKVNFYVGGSALNLLKPNQSFYKTGADPLYVRYIGQAGLNFTVNDNVDFNTSTLYQRQGPFQEFMIGFLGRYDFSPNTKQNFKIGVGMWYRMQDAIIPVVRVEYEDFNLTFNYDVNLSTLTKASRANGGPEISLVYTGFWNADRKKAAAKKSYLGCPVL
ncbi:MAG TPA: PorP/SprF family type IX secretion system membrane protein [Chitinophagales bacterium]|nr:PorP/SprF family type IX secretion system membrane protein [Chitinophagales bacterium]